MLIFKIHSTGGSHALTKDDNVHFIKMFLFLLSESLSKPLTFSYPLSALNLRAFALLV